MRERWLQALLLLPSVRLRWLTTDVPNLDTSPLRDHRDDFTPEPVPFSLRPIRVSRNVQGFSEHATASRHLTAFFGVLCVLMALFFFAIGVGGDSWYFIVWGAVSLLSAVPMSLRYNQARERTRHLWIDASSRTVHLERIGPKKQILESATAPLQECRLLIHPGKFSGVSGFAAVVYVGDRFFTLACLRTRRKIDAYVAQSPLWLRSMHAGEGQPIKTDANLRVV